MIRIFDARQTVHAPARELHNGSWSDYAETPARADAIAASLGETSPARDFGIAPISAVHDGEYLGFLERAHAEWRAAGREGDAIGYAWPVVGRRPLKLDRIDAALGRFSFDAATPIAQGTWQGAYWSAQTALTALDDMLAQNSSRAFALCRPPGHHAGADYCGGYCYLNNAAIVAEEATARGDGPVAILDIDYHHGNGTQDIFYDRGDIFFASIHADPATDFPFYWGHADECGAGDGRGATLNLPLSRGCDLDGYRPALDTALKAIADWGARFLVVSFGADIHADDPISHFALQTGDFRALGARIGEVGLPSLIVMEGGYAVDALGANVKRFLDGIGG
ncbi:MAG: histone deacetylase family protein [Parasphingopyxis sp.]|nr:histone deacetylase family protein [Sphingomonadales bacterium]